MPHDLPIVLLCFRHGMGSSTTSPGLFSGLENDTERLQVESCPTISMFHHVYKFKNWLGVLEPWNFMTFHSLGNVMIPTDDSSIIFQRGRLNHQLVRSSYKFQTWPGRSTGHPFLFFFGDTAGIVSCCTPTRCPQKP